MGCCPKQEATEKGGELLQQVWGGVRDPSNLNDSGSLPGAGQNLRFQYSQLHQKILQGLSQHVGTALPFLLTANKEERQKRPSNSTGAGYSARKGVCLAVQDGLPVLPERSHFLRPACASTAAATQTEDCRTWCQTELTKAG